MHKLILVFFLLLPGIAFADSIPIYSSGNFMDPSASTAAIGISLHSFRTLTAPMYAVPFMLDSAAILENVKLWSWDTTDGAGGGFINAQYSIFEGDLEPSGNAVAAGMGTEVSTVGLPGHRYGCFCGADGYYTQLHSFNTGPIDLDAGVPYWLVLSATILDGPNSNAYWVDVDSPGGSYRTQSTSGGWDRHEGTRAFALNGTLVQISEASSLLLLLFAIIWIMAAKRRLFTSPSRI